MSGRVLTWGGAVVAVVALAGLGVYFAQVGLVAADQLASVAGLFVAVGGLAVAIAGLRVQRRSARLPDPEGVAQDLTGTPAGEEQTPPDGKGPRSGEGPRSVRQRAKAKGTGRVYQAGRDQTINEK